MSGGVPTVEQTATFSDLASRYPGVEVWPDPDALDREPAYFLIVSKPDGGPVRTVAYVRLRAGRLERRYYDMEGEVDWRAAP